MSGIGSFEVAEFLGRHRRRRRQEDDDESRDGTERSRTQVHHLGIVLAPQNWIQLQLEASCSSEENQETIDVFRTVDCTEAR